MNLFHTLPILMLGCLCAFSFDVFMSAYILETVKFVKVTGMYFTKRKIEVKIKGTSIQFLNRHIF